MMKFFVSVLLVVGCGPGCVTFRSVLEQAASQPPPRVEDVAWPTVHVKLSDGHWGSGAVVKADGSFVWVVTANHVVLPVQAGRTVRVFGLEPKAWDADATIVDVDVELDVALLKCRQPPGVFPLPASLLPGTQKEVRFEPVWSAGTIPGWHFAVVTHGVVSKERGPRNRPVVTTTAWPGHSGGPVFLRDREQWKLWAIVVAGPFNNNGWADTDIVLVSPVHKWIEGRL